MNKLFSAIAAATLIAGFGSVSAQVTHRPLVEEYTGTWCGYCPRGTIAMELLQEKYGDDIVIACFHVDDVMQVDTYPNGVNITGLPRATVDRGSSVDPYYGKSNTEDMAIIDEVENAKIKLANADIVVTEATCDGDNVIVKTETTFILDQNNQGYRVGYLLISDNVSGLGINWAQSNYYSGASGLQGTPLEELAGKKSYISGFIYNDVVIDSKGCNGVPGSLPTNVVAGEKYTHQYIFDIRKNKLAKKESLRVVAYILKSNKIINSNKLDVAYSNAGIDTLPSGAELVETIYYTLDGRVVSEPSKGIYIKTQRYSDGTTKTTKITR